MSQELNFNANICEILDNTFEFTNKRRKTEDEFDLQFDDYRDINQEERTKYINYKLNKLLIQEKNRKNKSQ